MLCTDIALIVTLHIMGSLPFCKALHTRAMLVDRGESEISLLEDGEKDEFAFDSKEFHHVSLARILLLTCGMGG